MRRIGILGALALLAAATAGAAETKATFGVSVTVVYNCAMDTSKLAAEQRKVVEAECRKQNGKAQPK